MTLIACPQCDVLQRPPALPRGAAACCVRCGALLFRRIHHGMERTLALILTAACLFLLANAFPIVGLEVQGVRTATTLLGAAEALWDEDLQSVAALVFITTFLAPALELAAMLWLLPPLHRGRVPAGAARLLRFLRAMKPWNMVEVFMLGALVALVKLGDLAEVVPGIALWSYSLLILAMAGATAAFDPRAVWERLGRAA